MKIKSKAVGIVIGALAVCLLIAAVSLSVFVNTDQFRNILLNKINAAITGNLSLAGHDISLLKGRIALQNLTLETPMRNRLATLEYLMVDIAFLPLLTRSLVIETMILKRPDIRLRIDKDGAIDIVEAFNTSPQIEKAQTQEQSSTPFDVIAENIWITDGDCHIISEPDNIQADLNRITVQARADLLKKTGQIEIRIEDTALAFDTRHLRINPLALSVMLTKNQTASVAFKAKTDFAEIALNGEVEQILHNPNLNLELTFDVSLSQLKHLLSLPAEFSGITNGVLTVQGDWHDPDADLRLNYKGGSLAGYPVDGLHTDLRLKNRQLLMKQLEILAGTGEINLAGTADLRDVFPGGLVSSQVHPDNIRYDIKADLKHIDIAFLDKDTHGVKGVLNTSAAFKGEGIDLNTLSVSASMDVGLEKLFLEGFQHPTDLKVQASGKMEAGVIDSKQIGIVASGTRLNARGVFDLASAHIQGEITADTENIENPLSLFGVNGNSGACAIKADVSGSWEQPDIGLEITAKKMQFNDLRLGDVHLAASVDPRGVLKIISLKLENQGTQAQGNGAIQLFKERFQLHETMPLEASLNIANLQTADFLDGVSVDGSFEGEIKADGNLRSLQASAVLNGKDVAYEKTFLGDIDTNLRFLDGKIFLDQFRLKNQTTSYLLNGDIQVFVPDSWHRLADPVLNLDLKGDAVSIADYISDIAGDLYLDAHLEGPVSHLQGKGSVKVDHLDAMGQSVERVTLDIELKDNRLHVQPLQAVVEAESVVMGSGWIGFDGDFSIDLRSTGMWLNSIGKIKEMGKVDGEMAFRIRGEGNVKNPSIYGDIHVTEVFVNYEKMDDIDFQLNLVDRQLSIKGRQAFELDLAYHLLSKDFSIDLVFSDTNITPFFLIMGKKDFGGKLSGKMVAKGNTTSLGKSEALLDISNVSLTYGGVLFAKAKDVQGNLKDQHLSIPELHLDFLESGQLKVKGSGTLDGNFDLTVDGSVPTKAATLLLADATEMKGDIGIHAEIKGTVSNPDVSAEIVFHDVGCHLPQIDPIFKGINGKLKLTTSHLWVENITGKIDSGKFQVNGDVALENFRPGSIRLDLKINKLPIIVPETMDVLINTNLSASGTMENILLEGDIVIREGVYYKKVQTSLLESMKEQTRTIEVPTRKPKSFLFDNIRYNIRLKYREPFIVDNDIAYLEIHPDLALSGTLNAPVITGAAKVQEGTISFQTKSFVVERGIVNFLNPYKTTPEIDIVGSIRIRQWQISLMVHGPPNRLVVELSSTPSEEDEDIISLLVFGKTTYEMRSGSSTDADSTEALMAHLLATSFGGDVKETTGLDYLEVSTDHDETRNDSDTTNLTIGKDLSERLALKYVVGSGRGGYHQRAVTEYKLIEHILLSGFQDIEGSYGGEIIFRIEFRIY